MPNNWPLLLRYFSPRYLRLYYCLLKDPAAPLWSKLAMAGAVVYFFMPADLLPDWILGVGWLDDAALLCLAAANLVRSSPPEVVARHLRDQPPAG